MPPRQVHLDQLQAKARSRLKINGQAAFILKHCKRVAAKPRKRRVDTAPNTPGVQEAQWAFAISEEMVHAPTVTTRPPPRPPPWMEENEDYLTQLEAFRTLQRQREKLIAKYFADK